MELRGKENSVGNPRLKEPKGLSRSSGTTKKGPYEQSAFIHRPNRPESCNRHEILEAWWLEVSCCVFFISALIAIVVTIYPYEGRPLPRWPYRLSINSLISIYVVILRAAMLLVATEGLSQLKWRWFDQDRPLKDLLRYDDASRGPWGALMLLGWLRGRQWTSSCGALITVAALIVDPFAQQVLSTYDCRVPAEAVVATIPRTSFYIENTPIFGMDRGPITLELQNSINGGIFNPGRNVAFDCPTGNCTFPNNYQTVGFCGTCIDITNQLYVKPKLNESTKSAWTINLLTASNLSAVINKPPGAGEGSDYLLMKSGGGKTDIIVGYLPTNRSAPCAGSCSSLIDGNVENCNASRNHLRWGCESPAEPGTGIGAAQCSLFPCVRTYTAVVNGGRLTERLVSASTKLPTGSMVNVECLSTRDRKAFLDAGYDLIGMSWIPYNRDPIGGLIQVDIGEKYTELDAPSACVYGYLEPARTGIKSFLATFLDGTIKPGPYRDILEGPAQLQAIYNNGDITFDRLNETWRNLSDSITTYMRQHGMANYSAPATGQAFRDQTCVHIRWPFLAFPVFLVLFAIFYFICMIFETRRIDTSRRDWKSSPLPLLFHGLDSEALQTVQSAELVSAGQMEKVAKRISVRLSQTKGGWQFMGTQNASLDE